MGEHVRSGIGVSPGWWKSSVGIFGGVWSPFLDWIDEDTITMHRPFGYGRPFDQAPDARHDTIYRVKMFWDADHDLARIWIDDAPQVHDGSADLPMRPTERGIDTLVLHPANLNPDIGPLLRTWWGGI